MRGRGGLLPSIITELQSAQLVKSRHFSAFNVHSLQKRSNTDTFPPHKQRMTLWVRLDTVQGRSIQDESIKTQVHIHQKGVNNKIMHWIV